MHLQPRDTGTMNDTGTIITARIYTAIILMAFFLTTAGVRAAETDLNSIPESIRPQAARLIENGIHTEDAQRLTTQFLDLQADQKTILSAYQVLTHTVADGLPPEPVLNKAFEGTAKKVNPDLIVAAMQKVLDRYQTAYQQVRNMNNVPKNRVQSLGNMAAESMSAGLKAESLKEILGVLDQRTTTMRADAAQSLVDATLMSARDMSRLGTSHQEVAKTLCEALKTGMDGYGMMRFHDNFMNSGHNAGGSTGSHSGSSGTGHGVSGSGGSSGGPGGGGGGGGGSR